jgi:hypothetical protein
MARLYSELAKFATKEIDGKKAIQLVKSIWTVGEEEGYTSERGRLAHDAAIIALHHSEYVILVSFFGGLRNRLLVLRTAYEPFLNGESLPCNIMTLNWVLTVHSRNSCGN